MSHPIPPQTLLSQLYSSCFTTQGKTQWTLLFAKLRWPSLFAPSYVLLVLLMGIAPFAFAQTNTVWKDVPLAGGGYMTGLHFHPTQSGLPYYLRSDVAGPWKRTASGSPWISLRQSSFDPTLIRGGRNGSGCGALAIHPTTLGTIYAEFSDTSTDPKGGLYKTTDGGENWTVTRTAFSDSNYNSGTGSRKWGQAVVIDPQNPSVVYYGTLKNGIYRTLDGGADSWGAGPIRAYDGNIDIDSKTYFRGTRAIAINAKSALTSGRSSVIYASIFGGGIVRSTDGGNTWSSLTAAFNTSFLALRPSGTSGEPMWISSMTVGEDQILYVGYRYGLAKYNPQGTGTWSKITISGSKANSGVDFFTLAKSATLGVLTPRIAVLGHRNIASNRDWAVFRSTNGGTSWLPTIHPTGNATLTSQASWQTGNYLFQAPATITLNPHVEGEAYVLDAYSVWRCGNFWQPSGATSWSNDTLGAENIVPLTMISAPSSLSGNAAPLYTGISDIVGFRYTSLSVSPPSSEEVDGGDGREYVTGFGVQETAPDVVWAVKHRNSGNSSDLSGITLRSTNGGETWSPTTVNPYTSATVSYQDVTYPISTVSYAGAKIAVSATNGNNAVIIPGNYEVGLDTNDNGINDTDVPLNLPAKYTLNGGASWQVCKVAVAGTDLPPFFDGDAGNTAYRVARILTADRVNGGTFYAIAPSGGKVWRSFDSGATWSQSSGQVGGWGLRDSLSPPHLVAAPGRAGEVWAGMSGSGIFRSVDFGNNWQRITFFDAPGEVDNRASLVTFGKELPFTGADNPTIYVYTFPSGVDHPALFRCTNLKAAGSNSALLNWVQIDDWTYSGYKGFILEGNRQNFGQVIMANGTSFSYNIVPAFFETWALARGLTASNAARTADPDKDGITNFLEYATNGSPTQSTGTVSTVKVTSANKLSLTFTRLNPAPVRYRVSVSEDLVAWSTIARLEPNTTSWALTPGTVATGIDGPQDYLGNNTRLITITDAMVLDGVTRRFLRLTVE